MRIEEVAADGEIMVLRIKDNMTIGEGDELLRDKINILVINGRKKIVLSMEDMPYCDDAGLGERGRSYTTLTRQDGQLKLACLSKRVKDLLSITKLLRVFETFDSEEDAVASFTKARAYDSESGWEEEASPLEID
jgi:anti-sigma B factor antagonist